MDKKIYNLVQQIPLGKVATYGQIAKLAGVKNPRQVGQILHKNPNPADIPCHRVVNFKGKLATSFAFGGLAGQKMKLEAEGVKINNNLVDLSTYLWHSYQNE